MSKKHKTPFYTDFSEKDFFSLPGGGWIKAIPADHDVPCVNFVCGDNQGNKLAYVTDTGSIPCESLEFLMSCNILIVEANHDEDTLMQNNKYPDDLKVRVFETHLSNLQMTDLVRLVSWDGLQYVVCHHLSEQNNSPGLAEYHAAAAMATERCGMGCEVIVAEPTSITNMLVVL